MDAKHTALTTKAGDDEEEEEEEEEERDESLKQREDEETGRCRRPGRGGEKEELQRDRTRG